MTRQSSRPTTSIEQVHPQQRTLPGPVPAAARELLAAAASSMQDSSRSSDANEKYVAAHVAALRCAAAVLACRGRPTGRRQPRSAWDLLTVVAPEFSEWAAYFAAGAAKKSRAAAGLNAVSERDADDLVRNVELFESLVHEWLVTLEDDQCRLRQVG